MPTRKHLDEEEVEVEVEAEVAPEETAGMGGQFLAVVKELPTA